MTHFILSQIAVTWEACKRLKIIRSGCLTFCLLLFALKITAQNPTFNSLAAQSVPENTPSIALSANNTTGWSITGGEDRNKFTINSTTGVLTFVNPPDYENPVDFYGNNTYKVTITISNLPTTPVTANRTFTITVSIVDEAPDPPTSLFVISLDKANELKWTASASAGITGYDVFRSMDSVNLVQIGTAASTSYTDNNLSNGKFYFYKVRADMSGAKSLFTRVDASTPYPSPIARYMHFDGSGDYIEVDDSMKMIAIPYASSSTIECWIRFAELPTSKTVLFSKDYNGLVYPFHQLYYENGKLIYQMDGGGLPSTHSIKADTATLTLSTNTWYHIAAVYSYVSGGTNNDSLKLYINGQKQKSALATNYNAMETSISGVIPNFPASSRLVMGASTISVSPYSYGNYFKGDMAEVRLWKTELSAATIQSNMYARYRGDEANLIGLWHLDTLRNRIVYDYNDYNVNAKAYDNVHTATPRVKAIDDAVSILSSVSSLNINVRKNDTLYLPNGVPTTNVVTKFVKLPTHVSAAIVNKDSISYAPGCFLGVDTIKYLICDTTFFGPNPYIFSDTALVVITAYDNENPTVTSCPSDIAANNDAGNCSKVINPADPVFADNCAVTKVTWAMSGALTTNSPATGLNYVGSTTFPKGSTKIDYIAYDAAGNTNTCSFNVVVSDNENPTVTSCPSDIVANNDAGNCSKVIEPANPVFADNCAVTKVTWAMSGALTDNSPATGLNYVGSTTFPKGSTKIDYITYDAVGNTNTCSFNVVVSDNEKPTVTSSPSNITVNNDAGACGTVVTYTAPVFADNCDGSGLNGTRTAGLASGATFPKGATTVTYRYSDASSNFIDASFTVTVNDNEKPTVTSSPSNITVNNDAGSCGAVVTYTVPLFADNCDGSGLNGTRTAGLASGATFSKGATTVTYRYTDASGNFIDASFTVTVNDNEKPTVTSSPSNITVNNDAGSCDAVVTYTAPIFADNCDGSGLSGTRTAGLASGATFPKGATTVTYRYTDASSNFIDASFTVTVNDNEKPTITSSPSNITVNNDAGSCDAVVTYTAPIFADNCDGSGLNGTRTVGLASGATFPKGATTVTYRYTDASSNFIDASFTVTVNDNEKPTITSSPSNITVNNDAGSCDAVVTYTAPIFADNCDGSGLNGTRTVGLASGATFPKGATTVTYRYTDASSNFIDASFTVTVNDNEKPTVTSFPSNITVNNDASACGAVVTYTAPVFADNCDGSGLNGTRTVGLASGATFPKGTTTVTYRYTDASSNFIDASFTVIVNDNENPTVNCTGNKIVSSDLNKTFYTHSGTGWDAAGSDNCDIPTLTYTLSGVTTGSGSSLDGIIFNMGLTIVTWTATDVSSNTATCSFNVQVNDSQIPTISCISNKTVNTDANKCTYKHSGIAWDATGSDNAPGWVITYILTGATTGSGTSLDKVVFNKGVTTVTWTNTDVSNNTVTCSFYVVVEDHENPTLNCMISKTRNTHTGRCDYTTVGSEFDLTSFSDNCPGSTITNDYTNTSTLTGAIFPKGTTTVTWTVTDASGNKASCSHDVIIQDKEDPIISCLGDQNRNTDAGACTYTTVGAEFNPTAFSDNCPGSSIAYTLTGATTSSGANLNGIVFNYGLTTVTWTNTDANANTASCSYTVTVNDNQNPIITAPANLTSNADAGSCTASGVVLGNPVTTDNCGIATVSNNAPSSFPVGTTIVIWTVTDIHGNTVTANQNVIVNDNQNPTITAPADITVAADAGSCSATGVLLGTPITGDNCGVASTSNNAPAQFNVGITDIIWTVTDIHGNNSTATQHVIVNDNQKPTITAPANLTVNTDPGFHVATNVILGTSVTADNCGVASVTNNAPTSIPAGVNTVTWTVTDLHGNTNTATQTVTVIDNMPPTITSVTSASIPENTSLVMTVTATDPDAGDILKFSVTGGTDLSKFAIDSIIGALSFITPPDYEIPTDANTDSIYEVNVTVKDHGGLADVKTITVKVTNANDPPTDIILSKSSVDEHLPSGAIVGILTTIDEDAGDSHIYTISGADATFFTLTGDSLKTNVVFDYVAKPTYSIVVRSTDSQGAYFDKTFTISVNNINEPPVILSSNNNPIDTLSSDAFENETTHICLNVSDPDNDQTAISEWHSVNGSGNLSVETNNKNCFNYTPASGFLGKEVLFVRVCDNGVPSLCDTVIITMNVIPRFIFSQVISPNGDGINDTWVIGGLERFPDNKVTIFSRWGDVVYKARGYDNVNVFWNGDYNNGKSTRVPDGTYFYIIELGNGTKLNGFIVLNQ